MRVGVVGCGYWGSKHVRTLAAMPAVTQVVIIDDRDDVRCSVGLDYPQAQAFSTLSAAIDELDAVIVATPPVTHFDLAAEALEAGKHVLVEKPMATNAADAREMVRLASEAGVTLAVGHTFAYNAAVSTLSEIVRSGELGRLHYLDAARLNLGLYRDDVNVLWDLAAHDISITAAILDDVPDTVSAWGCQHTKRYSEDVATIRMLFEQRRVESTVRVSWLDPVKVRRTTVVGSEKMVVYNDGDADGRIKIFDRGRRPSTDSGGVGYHYGDVVSPHIDFAEPLRLEVTDFVECASTGRRPKADGLAGLAVVAVLEASDTSLRENGAAIPVEVGDRSRLIDRAVA